MVDLQELEQRVVALERIRYGCTNNDKIVVDDQMRRARDDVEAQGLYSAQWKWVPEHYYTLALSERAQILQAPSTEYLCKALLMENRKHNPADNLAENDPTNPKFMLVMVQYDATLDVTKLKNVIRKLRSNVKQRLEDHQFDIRVADPADNAKITGYDNNAVTPFGFLQKVPIILSQPIANLPEQYFWMGGGHVHLKLRLSISDFVKSHNPIVADITEPRAGALAGTPAPAPAPAPASKKEKQQQPKQQPQKQQQAAAEYDISALDIRVGKIIKVWPHEKSDKLFCEEIDIGEESGPRSIASGLQAFYKQEELQDQMVLVLANLKARKLADFPSHGMVMCASNADHTDVKLVQPPEGTAIGERVQFGELTGAPEPENKIAKKKIFEKLAPDLKTNSEGVVMWKDTQAKTSQGIISGCMPNAQVK